jgi:hypothetical protein
MPGYADPEHYFAIELRLAAVRNEDFTELRRALEAVRFEFSQGGSSMSIESVSPKTTLH